MKKLVTSYTFTPASKTIQAADFTSLEKIQLITNVTSNIIIYNFADTAAGGALSGTTLTLDFDTTGMLITDKLQIFVDDGTIVAVTTDGQPPSPAATATGGYTPGKLVSAASTNATLIKSSAGTLGYVTASNINASPRYLKLYNKASAPTVGTDVPVHTFLIPGNTAGAGTNIPLPPQGIKFATGIALALTTGATDTDSAAVALNEILVNYGYN
jgi:hypothetical protein